MTDSTRDLLTVRLERLERENRRSKRTTLVVLVGVAAVALLGQAAPHRARSFEAEEFVVRDSRGQVRASLGTTQGLSATVLQLHSENGKPRARITVSSDGTSSLEVIDTGERVRLLLGVKENGSPRIWLGNENGKIVWRAP